MAKTEKNAMVYHFSPCFAGNQSAAPFSPHPPHLCEIQQLLVLKPKKEKPCCRQGNKSFETQYRSFLAISRPPPASQQTNILLPTGLEFQHLFMFKRVNKRKHAVSIKKAFGNSISRFLTHFHAVTS
jgi:hypothetical protein